MNTINIEEIVIANTAGMLILLVSLLSRIENIKKKHFSDRLFDTMIGLAFWALAAEMLSFLIDGRPGALIHGLQYLLNAYLFFASCSVGALWVLYVDHRIYHSMKRIHRHFFLVAVPFALVMVMLVCDLFGAGFIFSITEQNVYHRGSLVAVPYVVLFYDYFISLIMAVIAVKRNSHVQFFPIPYFVLTCLAGTVIQGVCYGLAVGWFCVSMAFMFVQMHLYHQNAFVDDLSGLYNRKYCSYVISKMKNSRKYRMVSGIMIDVNHFKYINDQFGHTAGDDAIRNIGMLISEVITERDMAFRHAGDEFIIISAVEKEEDTKQLIDALTEKVEEFNVSSGKSYKLSLAMGYALCEPSKLDADSFLHQMDMKMYEAKNAYYARNGGERRGSYSPVSKGAEPTS